MSKRIQHDDVACWSVKGGSIGAVRSPDPIFFGQKKTIESIYLGSMIENGDLLLLNGTL